MRQTQQLQGRPEGSSWGGPHFRPLLIGITRFDGPVRQHPLAFDAIETEAVWIMTLRGHAIYETSQNRTLLEPGRVLTVLKPSRNRLLFPPGGCPWLHIYMHFTGEPAMAAFRYMIQRFGSVQSLSRRSPVVRKTFELIRLVTSEQNAQIGEHAWSALAYDWFQTWWASTEAQGVPLQEIIDEPPGDSRLVGLSATTLKGFAREMGYSSSHLSRRLSQFWGKAPGQALRKARLEESSRLLRSTRLSVEEISTRVGYRSTSSYIRAFRQMYGQTPLEHRHSKSP